jgi:hypothetical protein
MGGILLVKKKGLWRKLFAIFIVTLVVSSGTYAIPSASAATTAPAASTASISGTLTQGGGPKSGITFSIQDNTTKLWYDTTTDNQGSFTFQLPDGAFTLEGVWIDADKKWYPLNKSITVASGQSAPLNIDLPTLASTLNVSGVLSKNAQPLSNVTFSVHTTGSNSQWYDVTSGADGSFSVALPNGDYQLDGVWVASESKWYPLKKAFTVAGTLNLPIDVAPPGSGVTGSVKKDGSGLGNLTFSVHTADANNTWYDVQTDASGNFTANLPDGSYQVDGIWVGAEAHWYPLANQIFTVVNGAGSLNIALTSAFNITGTLTKGTATVPNMVFSIQNTASGQWYDTKTDGNGAFKFSLPDGSYQFEGVWVDSESKWYPLNETITVSGGKINSSSTWNIDLLTAKTPNVNISISKGIYYVADALVSAQSNGADQTWYNATTDGKGTYSFSLPDGKYHIDGVWVQLDNKWYPNKLDIEVSNGQVVSAQPLSIDLSVTPGNVKGQLVNGTPVNNTVFSAHTVSANPIWYNATTDGLGNFTFDLPDGNYQIDGIWVAAENKWYPNTVNFTVTGGQLSGMSQLLIDLKAPLNVSGTVTAAGVPVGSASISIVNTETGDYFGAGTDQNGKYTIQLPDGNYMVESIFTADYQTIYVYKNFSVVNGQLTVNGAAASTLDVTSPSVQGIVNEANVPVANATISIIDYSTSETTNASTDASGAFGVDLPDGDYYIESVTINGQKVYIYSDFTITNHLVYVNGSVQDQFALNIPPVVATGNVTADGAPIPDGIIWFTNLADYSLGRADVDANGNYSIRLANGNYTLDSVESSVLGNTVHLNKSFSVKNGKLVVGTTTLAQMNIALPSAVAGNLKDANKNPMAGYLINVEDANQNWISATTAADGSFSLRLPDGTYTVTDVTDLNGNLIAVNKTFKVTGGKLTNANDLALTIQ